MSQSPGPSWIDVAPTARALGVSRKALARWLAEEVEGVPRLAAMVEALWEAEALRAERPWEASDHA